MAAIILIVSKELNQKPKTIITGAAGFIGFHLMRCYREAGHDVVGVDRADRCNSEDIRDRRLLVLKQENCRMVFGDLAKADFVGGLFATERPNLVLHMAAQTNARSDDWSVFERDNVQVVDNLLVAAKECSLSHFVFASTSSVYGEDAPRPFREDLPLTEAVTPYEKTKQMGETAIQRAAEQWGLSATIVRFFNLYGPWGRTDMAPYIFADRLASDTPVTLYNGDTERAWLYIDDAVKACFDLAAMPPSASESPRIVNVAGPELVKTLDLLNIIAKQLNKTPQIQHESAAVREITSNPGAVERLRALTNSIPQTSFEQGISKFLAWHKQQRESRPAV